MTVLEARTCSVFCEVTRDGGLIARDTEIVVLTKHLDERCLRHQCLLMRGTVGKVGSREEFVTFELEVKECAGNNNKQTSRRTNGDVVPAHQDIAIFTS